jgi:hypothetical protein
VLAEEIDCYNDKDLYNLPECVERRALDKKEGNQQSESQVAPLFAPNPGSEGTSSNQSSGSGSSGQQSSNNQQQASGGEQQQSSSSGSQQSSGASQQQASEDEDDEDKPAPPRPPINDPKQAVLGIADAGKEATQYINDEGSDKFGKWARTRFERDRSNGASALGPNVIDTKVWVTKDAETAKSLYSEQSGIKNFPERKEKVDGGPVEKIKPTKYGDEFSVASGFFQDDKVWQHWRFVIRKANIVAVVYLFGREEFFQDAKDKGWTGQGDWFTSNVANRM